MNRPLVIDHVSDDLLRHRALQAARKRALDAWYGGAKPANPHGRRQYRYGRVTYLTENHAPLPAPPAAAAAAAGHAALRMILKGWRGEGEYAALGAWDDERGGASRRALVSAGQLLAGEPDDDARERADSLVILALGPPSRDLDGARVRLMALPAPAPWSWEAAARV
ncbi:MULTISPECIES: hypothetical protein [Methylobacteriaceae]|uniref:Uncharacterized protein n=2 Tax=Methylobacteriaceae TaxID=119045 RepID=A0AA40S5S0_9HYPH|nr:hypothetical protein [Methylorubrum thiocyanatum]AWI88451.1 hypothetical protein C0214_09445 [Methylobacterium sp. DM1]MBA8915054.1 hypothetical protein [Methylorubrum thiocyanatum]GJE79460.1 hypothetical protein CJNNKLLH_0786 [Methylorubrum thiocyanatum]